MSESKLPHRALSAVADTAAFLAVFWLCTLVAIILLSLRYPDAPWGILPIAIAAGIGAASLLLALYEGVTGGSTGRRLTKLTVVDARGGPLSRFRRLVRAALKYGVVVGALYAGVILADHLWAAHVLIVGAPMALFAAANILCCALEPDRRSLLDLAVRSRSV